MKMKDVCMVTGMKKRTIHFYIKEELIQPNINPENKYYEFSELDCQKLLFIRNMRSAGLSIDAIRSIIATPATANYYLNRHMSKLKKEKRQIEQVLVSMKYIMDELPLFPDFYSLYNLSIQANIPVEISSYETDSNYDSYNVAFINQHIWGAFLPKSKFDDYQEFLWMKLHKITLENPSEEYKKVANYLNQLPAKQIDKMFSSQTSRYAYIASLEKEHMEDCIQDMILKIKEATENPKTILQWKQIYDSYLHPITVIQASKLSSLVMQISPFYTNYVHNINYICEQVYLFLHSEDGSSLLNLIELNFEDQIDINSNYHGELEALATIQNTSMFEN